MADTSRQQRSEQPEVGGAGGDAGFQDGAGDMAGAVQRGTLGVSDKPGGGIADLPTTDRPKLEDGDR